MTILAVAHFACALAFAALAALIAAGRPSNRTGIEALIACLFTAIWAAAVALSGMGFAGVIPVLDDLRTLSWIIFAGSLLLPAGGGFRPPMGVVWLIVVPLVALFVLAGDVSHFAVSPTRIYITADQTLGRIAIGVLGVLVVENVFRNSAPEQRWSIAPICVALGGIFSFELIVYADAFLERRVEVSLLAVRAVACLFAVPLIALAMARNRNWRVDIHVSRAAVFHSATFIASGIFLLAVAAVGTLFRSYAGGWGIVIQISVILGGLLVLAMSLASGKIRSRLRAIVAENFFSHRYDYRAEWVKFIEALSSSTSGDLPSRVIRAIADTVDSPAGVLWLRLDEGYRPAASWNMSLAEGAQEPVEGAFVARFREKDEIQILQNSRENPSPPDWLRHSTEAWLAVPLAHRDHLVGFLLLAKPRASFKLDWEVLQLLRIVGRQSASYLAEAEASKALADAELLASYSKRFAFVIHDVKNLVSQLSLVLSNSEKFGNLPEFQQDALLTIHRSVERMKKLLQQLGSSSVAPNKTAKADVEQVLREVIGGSGLTERVETAISGSAPTAAIEPMTLQSILTHLVNNAIEASGANHLVTVRVDTSPERVIIDVCDRGPGMDESFIRNELFRPLRSTKTTGHGIGAFQSRELVRAAGGELEVISRRGAGTTMRIRLPTPKRLPAEVVSAA